MDIRDPLEASNGNLHQGVVLRERSVAAHTALGGNEEGILHARHQRFGQLIPELLDDLDQLNTNELSPATSIQWTVSIVVVP